MPSPFPCAGLYSKLRERPRPCNPCTKAQYIIGGGGSIFGHGSSSRIRPTIFRPNAAGNIFPSAGYAVRPDGACRGGIFVFHEKTQRMKSFLLIVLLSGPAVLARSQSVGDVVKQQAGEGVKTGAAVATEQTANNVSNRLLNKLFNKKSKNAKADSVKNAGAAVPVAAVPGAGNGAGAAVGAGGGVWGRGFWGAGGVGGSGGGAGAARVRPASPRTANSTLCRVTR